jgi:hypothetical protein
VKGHPESLRPTQVLAHRSQIPSPERTQSASASKFKRFPTKPVLASAQSPESWIDVDDPGAANQELDTVSESNSAVLEVQPSQDFFNRRKRSRFSKPFESLRAGNTESVRT